MTSKDDLRRTIKAQRGQMDAQQVMSLSQRVCERLDELALFGRCSRLFVYVSFGNEVHTHGLIGRLLDRGKVVAVPRMADHQRIEPVRIRRWDELTPDKHGILAPMDGGSYDGPLDACITPGVAFTTGGDRLGLGSGYYDRFLEGLDDLLVIGLAFECQVVDRISTEPHDRPVGIVVTEDRTIFTGHGPVTQERERGGLD